MKLLTAHPLQIRTWGLLALAFCAICIPSEVEQHSKFSPETRHYQFQIRNGWPCVFLERIVECTRPDEINAFDLWSGSNWKWSPQDLMIDVLPFLALAALSYWLGGKNTCHSFLRVSSHELLFYLIPLSLILARFRPPIEPDRLVTAESGNIGDHIEVSIPRPLCVYNIFGTAPRLVSEAMLYEAFSGSDLKYTEADASHLYQFTQLRFLTISDVAISQDAIEVLKSHPSLVRVLIINCAIEGTDASRLVLERSTVDLVERP